MIPIPALLSAVPAVAYRWLAVVALALALVAFGWVKGAQHGEKKLAAAETRALKEGVRITAARQIVTDRIVLKYVPAIERQTVVTETILKEVRIYVPTDSPPLPGGFRVLHDAAAAGEVPDPARIPHAAPVAADAAAETVAANYGACRLNAVRLQGMQEWAREQGKVK